MVVAVAHIHFSRFGYKHAVRAVEFPIQMPIAPPHAEEAAVRSKHLNAMRREVANENIAGYRRYRHATQGLKLAAGVAK